MVPPPSAPNFCYSCGAALVDDASFCSQCGTAVGDQSPRDSGRRASHETDHRSPSDADRRTSTDAGRRASSGSGRRSPGDAKRREFRARIQEYAIQGWEIEQDYGDRVVVRKRGFGSIPVHVLLLLITGGVGNVLYAWYRYGPGSLRAELHADGTERWVDGRNPDRSGLRDRATAAGLVVGGLLVFGFVLLAAESVLVGVTALCVALAAVLYWLLSDSSGSDDSSGSRRSPTTFGRVRTIEEAAVADGSRSCVACGSATPGGVVRTYADRFYLAGVPVKIYEEGENQYCRACASENADDAEREPILETER